jgi:hypothetical protein
LPIVRNKSLSLSLSLSSLIVFVAADQPHSLIDPHQLHHTHTFRNSQQQKAARNNYSVHQHTTNNRIIIIMTDTLCIFDGLMETENSHSYRGTLTWHGVWLVHKSSDAKAVAEPQRAPTAQMVESDMTFRVTGTATPVDTASKDSTWAQPCEIHWRDGSYDGAGRVTIQDKTHTLLVTKLRWTGGEQLKNLVFGTGENQFGKFIEVGWMRPGNRLTIARRYLSGTDDAMRTSWSLAKLKEMVLADIYDEQDDEIVMPPWHTEIFNSKYHG